MKVLFIRHGESRSNRGDIKASAPDRLNRLTKKDEQQIAAVAKGSPGEIAAVYSSPHNRTIISGEIFIKIAQKSWNCA